MQMLQSMPRGAYGLQIVRKSSGSVNRGSVYVLLGRLEEKGFVRVLRPKVDPDYPGPPRPMYQLTAEGSRVLGAAESIGLKFAGA
jgi:DNA-binding PadR family transcriptional regulator